MVRLAGVSFALMQTNIDAHNPIRRKTRRDPKIALPGNESTAKSYVTGEGLTREEWTENQRAMQLQAAADHNANIGRLHVERAYLEAHPPQANPLDPTSAVKIEAMNLDRMPLPPLPSEPIANDGTVTVPGRGPRVTEEGTYLDDGNVPVKTNRKLSAGRVADARKAAAAGKRKN